MTALISPKNGKAFSAKGTRMNEQRTTKADGNSSYDDQSYCYCFRAAANSDVHNHDGHRLAYGCHDVLSACRGILPHPF